MPDLVALVLPAGPDFVEQLERAWSAGDAVLPLDPRTPEPHLRRVMTDLAATHVIEADGERRRLEHGRPVEPGDALVVATSGTTGRAKGVVHTHDAVQLAAYTTATATGVGQDTWWLGCLPLDHVGGLGVLTRALITGARLELHPRFDPAAVDDAAHRGATHTSLVPTALARIDATRWRTILLGGSAIPTDRPANTVATYGMTETYGGVVYDGLALNGVQMRVVDPHADGAGRRVELAPPGTPGPIELRTATLMRCYRDGTVPVAEDGWYRTGDVGSIDPDTQLLSVQGRVDDLIVTGGENVWPEPVEAVLRSDHRVREVAVAGVPDAEWGQRVVAFVVPTDPDAPPPLEALRDLVRTQLPRAAAPKELRLLDSLPRTGLGKIRRTSLAAVGTEQHPDG